jgi:hypothetical protein
MTQGTIKNRVHEALRNTLCVLVGYPGKINDIALAEMEKVMYNQLVKMECLKKEVK